MKVLFANGRQTYPLFRGGDGISLHHILSKLCEGHTVNVLGCTNPSTQNTNIEEVSRYLKKQGVSFSKNQDRIEYRESSGYFCTMVDFNNLISTFEEIISSYHPDIVITQLENSHQIVNAAYGRKINTICFIHDHDPLNYQLINISHKIGHVIFNSQSTKNHYAHLLNCRYSVLYPLIKIENYKATSLSPKYITMFNPIKYKGSGIVDHLITVFPEEKFLLIPGWRPPELANVNAANVTVAERQLDTRPFYAQSKIILIPSQWEEAFCRIAPEAHVNSIPVIASQIGGLPESVGSGGVLIADFANPRAWQEVLDQLLTKPELQLELGLKGYSQIHKFSFELHFSEFESLLYRVHSAGGIEA